jgi:MSHA pilin protein MshA
VPGFIAVGVQLMGRSGSAGFTLVELVVVIAILGIIAAFAVPRFASLESEARKAATQGLHGSIRSAAAMAHSLHVLKNASPVVMEGNPITIVNGYPDYLTIADALTDTTGFTVSFTAVAPFRTVFAKDGAAGTCQVVYHGAWVPDTSPSIVVDLSGC